MSEDTQKHDRQDDKTQYPVMLICDRGVYTVPEKFNTGRAASEDTKAPPAKSDRTSSPTSDDQP